MDRPLGERFCGFLGLQMTIWSLREARETQREPPGASERPLGASNGRETTPEGLEEMEDFRSKIDSDPRGSQFIAHLSICSSRWKEEPERQTRARPDSQTSQSQSQTDRAEPHRHSQTRRTDRQTDGRPRRPRTASQVVLH